jgi:hypothetical protein
LAVRSVLTFFVIVALCGTRAAAVDVSLGAVLDSIVAIGYLAFSAGADPALAVGSVLTFFGIVALCGARAATVDVSLGAVLDSIVAIGYLAFSAGADAALAIGIEGAVYTVGALPVRTSTEAIGA